VARVLQDSRRFTVPIYQRQYAWGDEQLEAFWEDLAGKAEEALETRLRFQHYMGALILAPGVDGYSVGRIPSVQVVDGQQRLTTFQLFLAALRDFARQDGHDSLSQNLDVYMFNDNRGVAADDYSARGKLVPTPADRSLFYDLMKPSTDHIQARYSNCFFQNGRPIKAHCPRALWAYATLQNRVSQFACWGKQDEDSEAELVEFTPEERLGRLQALADAILLHFKLVIISLEEGDDAQVIFETLNSRGEPLLAMDLVRNNIFHRAEAQGESAEELFANKWSVFDEAFWKDPPPRAKPQKPRVDFFLSHALTAQTGAEISLRELYTEYRHFARPRGRPRFETVEKELDALLQYVPSYRTLEQPSSDSDLDQLAEQLATWEVTTAYPLVLCINANKAVDDAVKAELYKLIYSYVVRRAVCALPTKSLGKTFQRVVAVMLRRGVSRESIATAFAEQVGPTVRFPDNEEFCKALLERPLYEQFQGKVTRLVDILWRLELKSRTRFHVNTGRPASLSVEHILPQTWSENWPLQDGRYCPADRRTGADDTMLDQIEKRDRLLHTLGNLTLVTAPLNPSLSNHKFGSKKGPLAQSLLALNNQFSSLEVWHEQEIRKRGEQLAHLCVAIWPPLPSA